MSVSNSKSNDELVPIGKVGRPHGLRGAFFVSDRQDLVPMEYDEIYVGFSVDKVTVGKLEASYWQTQRPVMKCSWASDRAQIEAWLHAALFVRADKLRRVTPVGSMLWWDLEGALVQDSFGKTMGSIRSVYNAGSSDIVEIVVSNQDGSLSKCLDLPLIDDYLDTQQVLLPRPHTIVRLKVPADTFDGLWQDLV